MENSAFHLKGINDAVRTRNHLLSMLERASRESDPDRRRALLTFVVVGGGPCAYNPEPVADFFDAFAVGDGEDVVHEIADAVRDWKASGEDRAALHRRLARAFHPQ